MPDALLDIPADHPAFAGHFPGRPIVPGVVLLDQVQRMVEPATGVRLVGLSVAKFHSPAVPGDVLVVSYESGAEQVRFEVRTGERKVADGRFLVHMEPAA